MFLGLANGVNMKANKLIVAGLFSLASFVAGAQVATPPAPPATAAETMPLATSPATPPAGTQAAHELTAADVDAWLDGYMPYALATGDIAGAVVAVVKDGQIVTERGFGYSDVATQEAGRSQAHAVPSGLGVEALHLDGGDAAGRAGQARSRCGRQHVPAHRLPDAAARRQADHAAQHHDAHGRLRRADQEHHHRKSGHARFRHAAQALDAEPRVRRRHDAGLFELRDLARRLHRRARLRRTVLRLHRQARLRAAGDEALELPPAAAEGSRAADVDGLRHGIGAGEEIRNRRPRAGGLARLRPARTWRTS